MFIPSNSLPKYDKNDKYKVLNRNFWFEDFRPWQDVIIDSILSWKDTVAIMPTWGWKSICFQIPALLFPWLTIVISPLISLMKDQVDALQSNWVAAITMNSNLEEGDAKMAFLDLLSGWTKLLYISPEKFANPNFISLLRKHNINVSFVAVDEAHCVSQWWHDFRPSYTKLKDSIKNININGKRPIIAAFTATATPLVKDDIITQLDLFQPNAHTFWFKRDNLKLFILQKQKDDEKLNYIVETLNKISNVKGSKIIYASTQKNVEKIYKFLSERNYKVWYYHWALSSQEREKNQDDFMSWNIDIIVATNAFWMWVDKSDIRLVVHFNLPWSLEAYYQEIWRAWRDWKMSICMIFYSYFDKNIQEFFLQWQNPPKPLVYAVFNTIKNFAKLENSKTIQKTWNEIKEKIDPDMKNEMVIWVAIEALQKNWYIKIEEKDAIKPTLLFTEPYDVLKSLVSPKAKKKVEVLEKFKDYIDQNLWQVKEFDVKKFCRVHDFKESSVLDFFKLFKVKWEIVYTAPSRARIMTILKEDNLETFDWMELERKKVYSEEKLKMVEKFLLSQECKHNFILKYFWDENIFQWNCWLCNHCLQQKIKGS